MVNIIYCVIFGFFTIIGLANTLIFIIKKSFNCKINFSTPTPDNIEYIARSHRYNFGKITYQINNSHLNSHQQKELNQIYENLQKTGLI